MGMKKIVACFCLLFHISFIVILHVEAEFYLMDNFKCLLFYISYFPETYLMFTLNRGRKRNLRLKEATTTRLSLGVKEEKGNEGIPQSTTTSSTTMMDITITTTKCSRANFNNKNNNKQLKIKKNMITEKQYQKRIEIIEKTLRGKSFL